MVRVATAALVVVLGAATVAGCGNLFSDNSNHQNASVTGVLPDGGICTKDPVVIKNVMLAPPVCNATAPCPCGTFCSSQTGGNCIADCVDDTWCAPGYVCSPFGQCLKPTDGGTSDGAALALDPSCPRNTALLDSIKTTPRACPFDDSCPFGSFCNHVTELCDWSCKVDTDCAGMNTPGHTFACGCLGQCVEVAVPQTQPPTVLPSLEVTPKQYVFDRPATITTPVWGDVANRKLILTAVAQGVTTWPPSANFTVRAAGGTGLVGPFSINGTGPGKTIASNSNATLAAQDGVTLVVGDRFLVKDTVTGITANDLGIYVVTSVGSASTKWILTRATDYDTASSSEVRVRATVRATAGTANANRTFILSSFSGAVDATAQTYTPADFTVRLASTAALNATAGGSAGVGRTLTLVGNGALSIDGVATALNDRILLKNQVDSGLATLDGIYTVTQVGTASLPAILTRATDFDSASPSEARAGAYVRTTAGNTNANKTFILTAFAGAVDVGPQKYVAAVAGTTIIGPTIAIQANPGPGLMVQCPPATALSASPCPVAVDPSTFTLVNGVYRSAPIAVIVGPSSGAPTATSWDLRLDSTDLGNAPRAINLRYADAVSPANATSSFQTVSSPDPAFTGSGSVQFMSPTGVPMTIPVKARVFNGNLVLFDETRQLSPSGKLVLVVPVDYSLNQTFVDVTDADNDVRLQDTLSGGLFQRIFGLTIQQDTTTGNLLGTFQRSITIDYPFYQPATGTPTSAFDKETLVTFTLAKTTAGVPVCANDAQCVGGAHCDLGLCSAGPNHRFLNAAPFLALNHKRMLSWGANDASFDVPVGYAALYAPNSYAAQVQISNNRASAYQLTGTPAPVSGELLANLFDFQGTLIYQNQPQLAVPLLTQHDPSSWPMAAAGLMRTCLGDLARDPATSTPMTEAYDYYPSCINIGRVGLALGDKTTFQRMLQAWVDVHALIVREGVEELNLNDANSDAGLPSGALPTPVPIDQILAAGEGGLGLLLDSCSSADSGFRTMTATEIWNDVDFRAFNTKACTTDGDCNSNGQRKMACLVSVGRCKPLTIAEMPQHDQPFGVAPLVLEMASAYLKALEAYLSQVARQSYGLPADNSPANPRNAATARFGSGMRLVLAAEQFAAGLNLKFPCPIATNPNCSAITTRFNAARDEMNLIRKRVIQQADALRNGFNPFGFPEDDVPLFFGDPTGTNSRYFAASDYLIDGWAAPAVNQASTTLDSARAAWISKTQALVQDEMNQHNRDQEISQLMSKYGTPILANCGNLSVSNGTGGYKLLDSTEVIPYFAADRSRPLSSETCFIDPSCVLPPSDPREVTRLGLAANFLDTAGNLLPGDPTAPSIGPTAADFFVRSETCKVTWFVDPSPPAQKPFFQNYPALLAAVCPRETFLPFNTTAGPCTVSKWPADNNLYLTSNATTVSIPVAALYGPIKASDLGTYYQHTTSPVVIGGVRYDIGDPNNVFNYIDFRTSQDVYPWPYPNNPVTASTFFGRLDDGTITQCQNGFGRGDKDYPRPGLSLLLPPTCYKGALGVAFYEVQSNNLRLQRAKDILDIGKKNLGDTLTHCETIDLDNASIDALNVAYSSMRRDYEMASAFAGGVSAVLSPGSIASFGLSLIGQSVADEAAQIQLMEGRFARTEKAQECWNNFRAQRRGMSTALADIQIATSDVNAQATAFRNLQDANSVNLQEGLAVWDREHASPVSHLSSQFWVDEKVERFRQEFEWSRRLTFAAMRAVEYEFQQSLPFRSQIVSATTPSQLQEVILGLKQEQAARTINRRRPDEASIVVSLRDDVLGIEDRSADPAGERNWTPAQRFASRLWDQTYAVRDSKGIYLGQGIPFTLGPKDILETRCGERLWRATATLQGDALDASAPGASVLLLKRNTFASQYCAGKAPTSVAPNGTTIKPPMQVGVIHTSASLFQPGSAVDLTDANQFTAALLYPWFNVRKTDFYRTTYQDGASEELAGRGLYGDYVLLFPKQILDDNFTLNRVEDVLLRLDYLSVDNLSQ
jgi:hypothetical protein